MHGCFAPFVRFVCVVGTFKVLFLYFALKEQDAPCDCCHFFFNGNIHFHIRFSFQLLFRLRWFFTTVVLYAVPGTKYDVFVGPVALRFIGVNTLLFVSHQDCAHQLTSRPPALQWLAAETLV